MKILKQICPICKTEFKENHIKVLNWSKEIPWGYCIKMEGKFLTYVKEKKYYFDCPCCKSKEVVIVGRKMTREEKVEERTKFKTKKYFWNFWK